MTIAERPHAGDLAKVSSALTSALTSEVDEVATRPATGDHEILLAALGRTIARTVGEGVVAVDLAGHGRLVLKPDVDLHRTLGWFTTIYPVPLACTTGEKRSATEMLDNVHRTLEAVPHYGIGHGLLQYVYAPTARQLAAEPPPDIFFSYVGTIPELPSGEGRSNSTSSCDARARNDARPRPCHRTSGVPHFRCAAPGLVVRHPPDRASDGEALAERFPVALDRADTEAIAAAGRTATRRRTASVALVDLSRWTG